MDSSDSGKVHMTGPCEKGNKASGFMQFPDGVSSSKFVQDPATGRQPDAKV